MLLIDICLINHFVCQYIYVNEFNKEMDYAAISDAGKRFGKETMMNKKVLF